MSTLFVNKKALFTLKFNKYRFRHIKRGVTTTYYPNPNPSHKKGSKCGPRNPNSNPEIFIRPQRRRIAALGLGLGFLD